MNLNESRRTAIKFVHAEKSFAGLDKLASEQARTNCTNKMREATEALQKDPIAQQLLSHARDFERRKLERREAIKKCTLLGQLSDHIELVEYGEVTADPGDFKDSIIDDDWDQFCKALATMDSETAKAAIRAFSQLLCSLVIDLTMVELPPVAKFTI